MPDRPNILLFITDQQRGDYLGIDPQSPEALQTPNLRLCAFLRDRPEGFADGERLIAGRPHASLIPGYDPDRTYPFL